MFLKLSSNTVGKLSPNIVKYRYLSSSRNRALLNWSNIDNSIIFKKVFKTLTVPPLSIGVTEVLFAKSGKVLVLKQELMMSEKDPTRKLPAVLNSFGGIWSSPLALFMLMRFINFNMSVVVISEKEKHFACLAGF